MKEKSHQIAVLGILPRADKFSKKANGIDYKMSKGSQNDPVSLSMFTVFVNFP